MNTLIGTTPFVHQAIPWSTLKTQLKAGQLLEPDDPEFVRVCTGFNLRYVHRPSSVVLAKTPEDVRAALQFAKAQDLPVLVQNTGHGVVRLAQAGSLLIHMAELRQVWIDPLEQTATLEGGCTWQDVFEATRPYGLTGLVGDTPSVGVVGYTLGGGFGWFGREFGLACDSLLEVEMFDANGEYHLVNASSSPELFWALRGGAAGFGVVTKLKIRLYPIARALVGQVVIPIEQAAQGLRQYRDWLSQQPNNMASRVVLMRGADIEQMPPFLRNRVALIYHFCWNGDPAEGQKAAKALLDFPAALLAQTQELAPADFADFFGAPGPVAAMGRGELLSDLPDELLETILQHALLPWATPFMLEIRHMGGAVEQTTGAYSHRHAPLLLNVHTMLSDMSSHALAKKFLESLSESIQPFVTGAIAPNFLNGDEGQARDNAAYTPEIRARLKRLKQQFDPKNRFALTRTPSSEPTQGVQS